MPGMPAPVRHPSTPVTQRLRANSHDVLSLEDGENRSTPIRKKDTTRKRKPLLPLGEVIEISSDDDCPPAPSASSRIVTDLRRQVKRLKEENAQSKKDLTVAEKELTEARDAVSDLQASLRPEKGKLILDASHLEDQLSCEVCMGRLWSPHILPECGHIFCQTCLQEWFNTTLSQFLAAHPHYNINNPIHYMQPFPHALQPAAYPQYTCPTCRARVQNKPVEVFALKAIVRTIAAAAGESSPNKPPAVANNRAGKRSMHGVGNTGPWDGFFPRRM